MNYLLVYIIKNIMNITCEIKLFINNYAYKSAKKILRVFQTVLNKITKFYHNCN